MPKKVMIVDDSRMVHLEMLKFLERSDYEVTSYCRDGESAVKAYQSTHPDVVTMDILMPGMDGLETARAILEENPEARIIMVSSLAYNDTIVEASQIGAKGFLYKPFDREALLTALDQATSEG